MDEIDLFASRLNCQMKSFISWHPDPKSFAVDAFTENWGLWMIFVFPPFSLIQRVLSKVERDQATGLLIVPHWPTGVWYPQILRLLIQEPVMLPCGKRVPTLEHECNSSASQDTSTFGCCSLGEAIMAQGVHGETLEIMCASWRDSTKRQYTSYLNRR